VAHERCEGDAKETEWKWVADQIQDDEPATRAADVADQVLETCLAKVVAEAHTVGDVGEW